MAPTVRDLRREVASLETRVALLEQHRDSVTARYRFAVTAAIGAALASLGSIVAAVVLWWLGLGAGS